MLTIKIGRNEYEITEHDTFMENGACVQLLSQSKEKSNWGQRPRPVLSKKTAKLINSLPKHSLSHPHGEHVDVFRVTPPTTTEEG